jgi:hypothetical protein
MSVCPSCRNEIDRGVDPCPYCGVGLDWGQLAPPPASEPAPPAAEESPVPTPLAVEPPAPVVEGPAEQTALEKIAPEPVPGAARRQWLVLLPSVLVFMCMCLCCVSWAGYRLYTSSSSEAVASRPTRQERKPERTATVEAKETLKTQTSPLAEPATAKPPEYKVVANSNGEGVVVQEILISPQDATREKLDSLARHLAQGIAAEQNVMMRIYDDEAAIGLAAQANLPPEQQQKLFAHWRASYTHNQPGGVNKLEIWTADHQAMAVIDYAQQK